MTIHMFLIRAGLAGFLLALTSLVSAAAPEAFPVVWEESYDLGIANHPLAVDLGFDGRPEVVLTDNQGNVVAIDLESGRELWRQNFGKTAFLSPLVGNFLGSGAQQILLCGNEKVVRLLDTRTGDLLGSVSCELTPFVQPTLMPGVASADRFILIDDAGNIVLSQFKSSSELEVVWKFKTGSQALVPATVGPFSAAGKNDVVVTEFRGIITVLDGETGQTVGKFSLPSNHPISASVAMAQVEGQAEKQELVVADARGYMVALKPGATPGSIISIWPNAVSVVGSPVEALAAKDLNADGVADMISVHHGDMIFVDGLSTEQFLWSAINPPIKTPPTIVTSADGKNYAFVIDSIGTFYAVAIEGRLAKTVATIRSGGSVESNMVAAAVGPQKKIVLFAIRRMGGEALCYGTPLTSNQSDPVLWQTVGGSQLRSGNEGFGARERFGVAMAQRTGALQNLAQEMSQSADKGKWKLAAEKAAQVLSLDPAHEEALAVLSKAKFRARLPFYILGVIIFAVVGFLVGRPLYRVYWRKTQLKNGEAAVREGEFERASMIYGQLLERYPEDKDVNAQLAVLYMKQGDFSAQTIPVYERMYRHSPDNLPILQALTRAYLKSNRNDDQALEVFVKASDQFDDPGRLNHALGALYHGRGDDESAIAFLRKAMREDYRPHELILLLADVYLNLNVRAAAGIPIYEAAHAARPQDTNLLLALAESYAVKQQADEKAEDVYERLIELYPEHKTVRMMLARIKLREGAHDQALQHARSVLEAEPDTAEALSVMAQACIAAARHDADARDIYARAIQLFPDDAVLFKSIAHIYLDNGVKDDDATELILAAYRKNAEDVALARAAHQIAVDRGMEDLILQTGEDIAKTGDASAEIWNRLAVIYCNRNGRGEVVENALRQAMSTGECDARVPEMLAAIYAEGNRVDSNALLVYEALNQTGKLSAEVGAKFIQALLESGRIEEASTNSQKLIAQYPEDEALRRLAARASMESNQVDDALKQYETLLSSHPDDAEAVVQLATAYARKNRIDDSAMLLYAHAQQVDPDNPLFPIMKARTMAEEGNWRATSESLKETACKNDTAAVMVYDEVQKILVAHPGALPLRWLAVSLAFGLNKQAEALDQVVMIQERDPRQTEQAVAALDKLIAKDPKNGLAHLHNGRMLRQLGKHAESRKALETAFSLLPENQVVQSELAAIYDQVINDSPKSAESDELRFRLGKLCMSLKSYEKAIQCFQVTAQDFRYESESIKRLAESFMAKGMLDLALQEFKKLHIDSEVKDLLYQLAQRYEQKHDLVGAKTVYRQLFAADIAYRDVREKFEALAGSTSDPLVFEKTSILNSLSDEAKRRYELIEEIGRGAMGIVYKAHDNELNEVVALKILPDNLSNNPDALKRFKAEARSARRLSHPNIVRIHDIGEEMGRKYISMEFVEGTDLKKNLKANGTPDFQEVLAYARQICAAIAYAHSEGIIHRDIKPANIMLTKDKRIKVTDFGIAKVCESPDATLAGAIMGTPLYMSPEQVQGVVVDNRSDIYSLGILFYELTNGRPPFTEGDLAYQHMHVDPKPLENVPEEFWQVVKKSLSKNREDRWTTVDEMLSALMKAD